MQKIKSDDEKISFLNLNKGKKVNTLMLELERKDHFFYIPFIFGTCPFLAISCCHTYI